MAIIPDDKSKRGIVIEFKVEKEAENLETKAESALEQICELGYVAELKQHNISNILQVAIAFCGKKFTVQHSFYNTQESASC